MQAALLIKRRFYFAVWYGTNQLPPCGVSFCHGSGLALPDQLCYFQCTEGIPDIPQVSGNIIRIDKTVYIHMCPPAM